MSRGHRHKSTPHQKQKEEVGLFMNHSTEVFVVLLLEQETKTTCRVLAEILLSSAVFLAVTSKSLRVF